MWGPHGQPRSPPLFTYNARLAHVGPSRHLHRGTHQGHVVQVGFWYMGPMWAAPDLSHVGFWYMGPMWAAPDLSHVGFWYMGPMWEAPDLPHVGFWYMGPMWAAPDLSHVGFWYMGPMWKAPDLPHVGFCLFIDSGVGCNRLLPQIHVPDHLRN